MNRGPLYAFLGLAVALLIALELTTLRQAEAMRDAQIRSCERVNVVRAVLYDFLIDAAEARREAGDLDVAQRYEGGSRRLASVPFTRDPASPATVDCDAAFR